MPSQGRCAIKQKVVFLLRRRFALIRSYCSQLCYGRRSSVSPNHSSGGALSAAGMEIRLVWDFSEVETETGSLACDVSTYRESDWRTAMVGKLGR